MSKTLGELAQLVGGQVHGDPTCLITGIGTLQGAGPGQITFLTNPRYSRYLAQTQAAAVILDQGSVGNCPVNALIIANPYLAYARLSALFDPAAQRRPGVHSSAVIDPSVSVPNDAEIGANCVIASDVSLGAGVRIGPGCVIERGVHIGQGSNLVANVTLYHGVTVGKRVLIHAGSVIGSDGFGFANDRGRWVKIHQIGTVRIGDDVEIGANTSIDRGAIEDTVIEEGVIIDNQVQVAHNVHIGAHTAIAGCVGIAGSAVIGRHCAFGGGAGVLGHLQIADGVTVTAMSLVTKSIKESGVYSSGTPLEPSASWQKNFARFKQLDDMARRIRELEKHLKQLNKEG